MTRRARRRPARGQNARGQNARGRPAGAWLPDPVVVLRDGEWVVRPVTGAATAKVYRCPGCDHEINPGTAHLVVWPPERVEDRRHWHRPCWDRRCRAARLPSQGAG
ncbi:hypothetical protein [Frankia sp. AiPs1]|uniref:hypothetical protein n=1 Tax=Frankia sp. AiPs1 TaxID=573493 RepID=UPI0035AC0F40